MADSILAEWSNRGAPLDVPGTAATRVWRMGSGPPVLCLHGVPTSAYLYRKVLPELAARGLEGVALDFPGLGFAGRPEDFDYSWTGLSAWLERAVDVAELDRFHLVVHDLGGPVGFDLIRRIPDRILSLTVLDTLAEVSSFRKPWVMRPFSVKGVGRLWTLQMNSPIVYPFFRWKGVLSGPSYAEIRAYGRLIVRGDGGRAFRRIMSSFETTDEFEQRIVAPLRARAFPAQVLWGVHDAELTIDDHGAGVLRSLGHGGPIHELEGKHLVQENSPVEIAQHVGALVEAGEDR